MNGKKLQKGMPGEVDIPGSQRTGVFGTAPKRIVYLFLLAFAVIGWSITDAHAQDRVEITGTVTDAMDGEPLPGASIVVQGSAEATGSTIGTTSGMDGTYSIRVPDNMNILVVSFIGYISQTVQIEGRTQIDIALEPDIRTLDDIVVVGYGTQRQRDATGSVASISERDFNQGVISSPEQLLQGRISGVQITTASGEPGAGANIRIRGTSSVRSDNQPLIVVDGVPLSGSSDTPGGGDFGAGSQTARNPLSFLNPDDIESISILKDASAAAIYGARGSNGVILITTKSGPTVGQNLSFSSTTSFSHIPNKIDLLSADEYVSAAQQAGADAGVVNFGANTDWQDEVFRSSVSQDYNLSYGSGTESGSYRVSLGYTDQQGIVRNSGMERISARVNATQRFIQDRLVIDLNVTGSRINHEYAPVGDNAGFEGDLVGAALQANPTRPVRMDDGTFMQGVDFRNPRAMLAYIDDNSETSRVLANAGVTVNITNWLAYRMNLGLENSDAVRRTGINPNLDFQDIRSTNGRATINNLFVNSQLLEHTLTMQQSLGGGEMELLGGFSYQRFESKGNWTQAEYFVSDEISLVDNIDGVDNVNNRAFSASSFRNVDELQSFFGRLNYNYQDRYSLTANFRADGSSKFGANSKYGYFPSLSVAWRLSNERFFDPMTDLFSDFRIRGGYGITGNQEFPGGVSLAIFRTNADGSLTQQNNPNPDIQWEETKQWGAGLDYELLEGRFGGSVDFFHKETENLIFRQDFAQPAAVDFQWVNLDGTVLNRGWEFNIYGFPVNRSDFSWRIDYNMSFLHNEVKNLDTFVNTGQIHGQGLTGAYAQRIAEGQPLFSFYLREFAGFDEDGLGIYANNEELDFQGSPIPTTTLGITNTFNIGRFDISAFLEGSFGFYVYNNTANAIFLKGNLRNGRNVTRDIAEGPESPNNFGEVSTRFLEKGDFVRLANLNVGYNFNTAAITDVVRNLRVSLTGQNLFVITNYTGFDPEVNTNKAIEGVPSLGIDYTPYPRARTISLNVRFDI
jgi:TonB-dependent starch-binding outer membrane protein SusC